MTEQLLLSNSNNKRMQTSSEEDNDPLHETKRTRTDNDKEEHHRPRHHHAAWWVDIRPFEHHASTSWEKLSIWASAWYYKPCQEWESLSKEAMMILAAECMSPESIPKVTICCEKEDGRSVVVVAHVPEFVLEGRCSMIKDISPDFIEGATKRFVMRDVREESVYVLISFLLFGHPSGFYDKIKADKKKKRFDAAEVWSLAKQFDIKGVCGWLVKNGINGKNIPAAFDFAENAMCADDMLRMRARQGLSDHMKIDDLKSLVDEEGNDVFGGLSADMARKVQSRFSGTYEGSKVVCNFLVKWARAQIEKKPFFFFFLHPRMLSSYHVKEEDLLRLKECGLVPPRVSVHVKWWADDCNEDDDKANEKKPQISAAEQAVNKRRSRCCATATTTSPALEFDVENLDPFASSDHLFKAIEQAVKKSIKSLSEDKRWRWHRPLQVWHVDDTTHKPGCCRFPEQEITMLSSSTCPEDWLISKGIGSEGCVVYASFQRKLF